MAGGGVRAEAVAYFLVVGLAVAGFAFCTIVLQQLQLETTNEAMAMGLHVMMQFLWGMPQPLLAVTAVRATRRVSTVLLHLLGHSVAWFLVSVLVGVADLVAGRCLGDAYDMYVFRLLFIGGLVVAV